MAYEGAARMLVRAWKERGVRRVVDLAAELVVAQVERPAADVIAYIPPDRGRQLARGLHPAVALAAALADAWNLELAPLLERARPSARQTGSRRSERIRNVRGAFAAAEPIAERVVLVDDVYTTGATADAAAAMLRRSGAATVHVVSFARAVR